jgi:hypothetical protein
MVHHLATSEGDIGPQGTSGRRTQRDGSATGRYTGRYVY